jgi:hypothetical protein
MDKYKITSIFLLILIAQAAFGQNIKTKNDYLNHLQKFYNLLLLDRSVTIKECSSVFDWYAYAEYEEYLFDNNCKKKRLSDFECRQAFAKRYANAGQSNTASLYFLIIKEQFAKTTGGLGTNEITNIIQDSSELIDFGAPSAVFVKIAFPQRNTVYFLMNKYADEPQDIGNIFLPDGSSVFNKIYPAIKQYLDIDGRINDPDGFVNVREEPDAKAPIIGVLKKGDEFSYYPNSGQLWWKVVKKSSPGITGYVFSDRVIPNKK